MSGYAVLLDILVVGIRALDKPLAFSRIPSTHMVEAIESILEVGYSDIGKPEKMHLIDISA